MRVLLLAIYEMGRQPFGLASPAAWLRAAGHDVTAIDLARGSLSLGTIQDAHLIALHIPMHTATRLALQIIDRVREGNAGARICCYGLYAPMNEKLLRARGVEAILGGEFEAGLVAWAGGREGALVSLERQQFLVPDRTGLPALERYAGIGGMGAAVTVGYTEASRGCKHLCRHCPVVPVYGGVFRVVQRDVVLADVRQQVAAGARHITFGDPDFFNGIGHALPLVRALHEEFPEITYDVTIKVEHLLRNRKSLGVLRETGCLFVTSAVESMDNAVLDRFAKGHTREQFYEAVAVMREAGLRMSPTFVTFTPWTTTQSYRELLRCLVELGLVESVAPIQLAIRLLIPSGSRLLDLEEVRAMVGEFDAEALVYPWRNPNSEVDALCRAVQRVVESGEKRDSSRSDIFAEVWEVAFGSSLPGDLLPARATIPYLNEPWYC